jgi:hypothetical protein
LPCISINTFLSRLLMSIKKVNQSFYFQVGFNIVMLVAIFVFTKLFYLKGFMWSMLTVYYLYSTVVCIFLMKWLMPYIEYRKFLWLFLQIILLNLPLCIIFLLFFKHLVFIIPVVYAISLLLINKATSIIPHLNLNIFKLSKL